MKKILLFLTSIALVANSAIAQTINPSAPAQAGNGLSQAGSVLNVVYGSAVNTSKQGNAVDSVAQGGTGLGALTLHNLIIGNGTSPATLLAPSATAGQVLTSAGAATNPIWQTPPTSLVSSVFGQTGAIPNLTGAIGTSGSSVTSFLPGGSSGQVLSSNGASAPTWAAPIVTLSGAVMATSGNVTSFTPAGTANQVLTSNGASAPTFKAAVNSALGQTGTIANLSGAVTTSNSSVTAFGAGGTAGFVLTSNGASPATYQSIPTATYMPSVNGLAGTITASSATATFTAKSALLVSGTGISSSLLAPSASINLATTGAGGMDTGAAPTSGFVAVYYIYNGTTLSTLGVNASSTVVGEYYTGDHMPAGYTLSALATILRTNAGATFVTATMVGRNVSVESVTLVNSFVPGQNAWYTLSLAGAAPPNTTFISGFITMAGAVGVIGVATGSTGGGQKMVGDNSATGTIYGPYSHLAVISNQIYYYVSASFSSYGVYLSGYDF